MRNITLCNEYIDCGCLEGASLWLLRRIDFDENHCACAESPSIVAATKEFCCGCFEGPIPIRIIAPVQ